MISPLNVARGVLFGVFLGIISWIIIGVALFKLLL